MNHRNVAGERDSTVERQLKFKVGYEHVQARIAILIHYSWHYQQGTSRCNEHSQQAAGERRAKLFLSDDTQPVSNWQNYLLRSRVSFNVFVEVVHRLSILGMAVSGDL